MGDSLIMEPILSDFTDSEEWRIMLQEVMTEHLSRASQSYDPPSLPQKNWQANPELSFRVSLARHGQRPERQDGPTEMSSGVQMVLRGHGAASSTATADVGRDAVASLMSRIRGGASLVVPPSILQTDGEKMALLEAKKMLRVFNQKTSDDTG